MPDNPKVAIVKACFYDPQVNEFGDHYYSVPFRFAKDELEVRLTARTVEVFRKGERTAAYLRNSGNHRHTTTPEHMPSSHRHFADWSIERIRREASAIGCSTGALCELTWKNAAIPSRASAPACSSSPSARERVEAACQHALEIGARCYGSVRSILDNKLDRQAMPHTTRQVGALIEWEFGIVYESRAGLIALLHRLGLEYHKPEVIVRMLNAEKQQAFIAGYETLQNSLGPDEEVLFVDAVHPTHAARPVGCWAPKEENLAIEQTSGRQRINIHGALNLETAKTSENKPSSRIHDLRYVYPSPDSIRPIWSYPPSFSATCW